jgi:hypothetical protein
MTETSELPKDTLPLGTRLVSAAGVVLVISSLAAIASLLFLWLAVITPTPADVDFGPTFGYVIYSLGLSVIWWIVAFIGLVLLWVARVRSIWSLSLVANILLAAFLLFLAWVAFDNFAEVGSSDSRSIGYGPSVVVGCALILPAVALLIWPRTRSTTKA